MILFIAKYVDIFIVGGDQKDELDIERQKKNVWSMIALSASDQLRQKTAWALSQILVVTPDQVS